MTSQVFLSLDDWVPILVDDTALETMELRALVYALPTKDSRQAIFIEVEAVDPVIALALDAPVDTDLEAEYSLALDDPVATDLEAEGKFLAKKPRSDN